MTTALEKLIADNKLRPIEKVPGEPCDSTCDFLLADSTEFDDGVIIGHRWKGVWCNSQTNEPFAAKRFRHIPDDRLAEVCEVLLKSIKEALEINEGVSGFLDTGLRVALARADEIAK